MAPASFRFSILVTVLAALIGSPITSWGQGAQPNAAVSIRGAGSTFAAPFYRKMIEEYAVAHRDVSIGYDAVGSGEGVRRFIARQVDFAGSDEILTESEAAKLPETAVMLPVTAGMIALAYNIPGVNSEIRLPRDVYIDILAGGDPAVGRSQHQSRKPRLDISRTGTSRSSPVRTAAARQQRLRNISPRSARPG